MGICLLKRGIFPSENMNLIFKMGIFLLKLGTSFLPKWESSFPKRGIFLPKMGNIYEMGIFPNWEPFLLKMGTF